jgi:hypothetical protein
MTPAQRLHNFNVRVKAFRGLPEAKMSDLMRQLMRDGVGLIEGERERCAALVEPSDPELAKKIRQG